MAASGPGSGSGPEWIEIIEADPSLFGAGSSFPADVPRRRASVRRGSRSAVGLAVLALLTGAAVVGVRLQPWHRGPHALSFPAPSVASAGDGHWVFGTPPGLLVAAGTGDPAPDEPGPWFSSDMSGYLFADPDASISFGDTSSGRYAMFTTRTYDSLVTGGSAGTVQGTPAVIANQDPNRIDIEFGPIDGRLFDVTANDMSMQEVLRFAEAVGLHDGAPTISDDRALAGLRPVASFTETTKIYALLLNSGETSIPQPGLVFATYRVADGVATVASIPFAGTRLTLLLHLLFPTGVERTVHGVIALAVSDAALPPRSGATNNSMVMWHEDGRLVQVNSPGDIDAAVALAESVRAATADEWADVVVAAKATPNPASQTYTPSTGGVLLLNGNDPTSGDRYTVSAGLHDDRVNMCAALPDNTMCSESSLPFAPPYLTPVDNNGLRFVVAIVPADIADTPYVRIRFAQSAATTDEIHMLADRGEILPGPATALLVPEGAIAVELWNAGKLVGTIDPQPPA